MRRRYVGREQVLVALGQVQSLGQGLVRIRAMRVIIPRLRVLVAELDHRSGEGLALRADVGEAHDEGHPRRQLYIDPRYP